MSIQLHAIRPLYMSEVEVSASEIYLQDRVSFEQGKQYLIKANSGHGKTSVLNFIYGSNSNFEGHILYDGVTNADVFHLRQSRLSYVFQDFKLFPSLTVLENIQLKNTLTHHKTEDEVDHLVNEVALGHKRNALVSTLSLGQKQRVAILRALCQPFDFLLLDEPFSHLDRQNSDIAVNLIQQGLATQQAGLIMTSLGDTHHFDFDHIFNL